MKKLLNLALASFAAISFSAHAEGILNSYVSININAPASNFWDVVKDFDGLENWCPPFSGADIKSGTNNEVGAIRTLTIKDGPSFDERLLAWDPMQRSFTYMVIDPAPLPVKEYEATLTVIQLSPGLSNATWSSAYQNNSNGDMTDDEVIEFINGVYGACLSTAGELAEY
ncbi:MAG: SRPBCC family protein [Burkholderiales bacterium]|jgi:hypothetical protein